LQMVRTNIEKIERLIILLFHMKEGVSRVLIKKIAERKQ
ncbi:MAG: hypothetical protein K0R19_1036, partial [Bacillota bacterium]|nr:hypothetical protein [Bacillota bacterium]